MGERPVIVIVGAGIAGLTAALAIAGAGFDSVVVEKSAELLEIGAGIQLSPNAGRVLASLGLDDAVAAAATVPEAIVVRDGRTGGTLTRLTTAAFARRYGFPYRVIHRADLQSVLADAVRHRPGIRLVLGAEIDDVLPRDDGLYVRIRTADGSEIIAAAGLVGADGVWSQVRPRIPGTLDAKPTGRTAWRTVIPADIAPADAAMDRVGLWLGPGAHVVVYPVARGAALNVVAIVEEPFDRHGWATHADPIWIAERLNAWCAEVRALANAPTPWQKFALHTVDPTGPWIDRRIALVGDAAHAMVPFLAQGGAMAIEDAAVLARALAAHPADPVAAFATYEAARKPRVSRVWKAALRTGGHYHQTGFMAAARDLVLRTAGERFLLARNDWIYRWTPDG
jgi:salicylate hydroxylase